jgi:hypothetical protein
VYLQTLEKQTSKNYIKPISTGGRGFLPGLEHKDGGVLLDDVSCDAPGASFQSPVGQILEAEPVRPKLEFFKGTPSPILSTNVHPIKRLTCRNWMLLILIY